MKSLRLISAIIAVASLYPPSGYGQAAVQETPAATEVRGTVAVWHPDSGTILTEDAGAGRTGGGAVEFTFAKKVEYVDKAGKPVTREVIQPGDPVTLRYLREGDRLLVSRVTMERKPTPVPTASAETPQPASPTAHETTPNAGANNALKEIEKQQRQLTEHHR